MLSGNGLVFNGKEMVKEAHAIGAYHRRKPKIIRSSMTAAKQMQPALLGTRSGDEDEIEEEELHCALASSVSDSLSVGGREELDEKLSTVADLLLCCPALPSSNADETAPPKPANRRGRRGGKKNKNKK